MAQHLQPDQQPQVGVALMHQRIRFVGIVGNIICHEIVPSRKIRRKFNRQGPNFSSAAADVVVVVDHDMAPDHLQSGNHQRKKSDATRIVG